MLLLLVLMHGLVDAFATSIQPLWPDLQRSLALRGGMIDGAYVAWNLATSVSQLFFGYWGDRGRGRWLFWAGPALAVLCMSGIGLVDSFAMLCVLLVLGGLGVAAFHPEAAAIAGACAPGHRSRAMSVFAVGGYLGQAAGPLYSGMVTTRFGAGALAWGLVWGLGALVPPGARTSPRPDRRRPPPGPVAGPSLRELVRGKSVALGLVLVIGTLRVLPAMGSPAGPGLRHEGARGIERPDRGGPGGLPGGDRAGKPRVRALRPAEHRTGGPLDSCRCSSPRSSGPSRGPGLGWSWPLLGAAGLLPGATMPVLVSYGQQLLPEGQRIASSLTMGVTWGIGGTLVAATMAACNGMQRPELAFHVFAAGCVLSSLLCA